ncbi:hypothetical protein GGE07_005509 [Sinorhizobium terangae]|uniref:hypothetical protein n=1 Tax=Sinorhizobium terangae TaxID=110322 RepID=UPI0018218544|nr:hypothetical protein [Sinorhizobium terangae]MBB4188830.1 hypothetical protein [Sinorhizobium terangae]
MTSTFAVLSWQRIHATARRIVTAILRADAEGAGKAAYWHISNISDTNTVFVKG